MFFKMPKYGKGEDGEWTKSRWKKSVLAVLIMLALVTALGIWGTSYWWTRTSQLENVSSGLRENLSYADNRVSQLRSRISQLENMISELKVISELNVPSPALPSSSELGENWVGWWRQVTLDDNVLTELGFAPTEQVTGFVKASQASFQRFEPYVYLRFVLIEFTSVEASENMYSVFEQLVEEFTWENKYQSPLENAFGIVDPRSDTTVFYRDCSVGIVEVSGENVMPGESIQCAEIFIEKIGKIT